MGRLSSLVRFERTMDQMQQWRLRQIFCLATLLMLLHLAPLHDATPLQNIQRKQRSQEESFTTHTYTEEDDSRYVEMVSKRNLAVSEDGVFQYQNMSATMVDESMKNEDGTPTGFIMEQPAIHSFTDLVWVMPYFNEDEANRTLASWPPSLSPAESKWISLDIRVDHSALGERDVLQVFSGSALLDGDLLQEWRGGTTLTEAEQEYRDERMERGEDPDFRHVDAFATQATIRLHRGGSSLAPPASALFLANWSLSSACPDGYSETSDGMCREGSAPSLQLQILPLIIIPGLILIIFVVLWLMPWAWRKQHCPSFLCLRGENGWLTEEDRKRIRKQKSMSNLKGTSNRRSGPDAETSGHDPRDKDGDGYVIDDEIREEVGGFFRRPGGSDTKHVIKADGELPKLKQTKRKKDEDRNKTSTKSSDQDSHDPSLVAAFEFSDNFAEREWTKRLRREIKRTIFVWICELIGTGVNLFLAITYIRNPHEEGQIKPRKLQSTFRILTLPHPLSLCSSGSLFLILSDTVWQDRLSLSYLCFAILAFLGACMNAWSRLKVIREMQNEMAAAAKQPLSHDACNDHRVSPLVELAFLERHIHHLKIVGLTLLVESIPFTAMGFFKLFKFNIVQNNLLLLVSCAVSAFWVGSKLTRLLSIPEYHDKARRLEEDAEAQGEDGETEEDEGQHDMKHTKKGRTHSSGEKEDGRREDSGMGGHRDGKQGLGRKGSAAKKDPEGQPAPVMSSSSPVEHEQNYVIDTKDPSAVRLADYVKEHRPTTK